MGTVRGDLHDIGKNLVGMMAEGAGFEVHDIGVDQSVEKFMAAAEKCKPTIVGMSALLTTTMMYMKTVIDGFQAAGRGDIKMAVGGAPISQMFADEIGADGYGANASAAVDLFLRLARERNRQMATYKILYWQEVPPRSRLRTIDDVTQPLAEFMERIDRLAANGAAERGRLPGAVEMERGRGARRRGAGSSSRQ